MGPILDGSFRAEGVTKVFNGSLRANDAITLHVEPGEVYGLLGPNGAGKSTLVKQVIGLLKPTEGRITLGPYDLVEDPAMARQLCSYLPQAQMPIDAFKTREAIRLTGRIRGGDGAAVDRRTDELIEALDLSVWRDVIGAKLSGGVKRLVGFSMVSVWPGRVVILDEPTNDVDPLRRRLLWDEVRRLGEWGSAVFLVTHNVMEAEKAVDRLAIIADGRLIAEGTPSSLKAQDRSFLRLQLMLVPSAATPTLPPFVMHHTRVGHNLVTTIGQTDASHAIAWAQEQIGCGVAEEYALGATTLEDVYIRLTGHVSSDDGEG
ncbi:MAG TPA: ABC transporter ATP-binding protein [Actinomycetota bacterium]|nr:ABC transporter ATP-binding protein [Actinomycetota bacterium]